MKIRNASMAGLAMLLVVPAAWAQAGSASSATAEKTSEKVAVVNLQEAIATSAEGKQAAQELRAQFAPRQTELANLGKQIQDLQQRLQTGATTLSDVEKARLTRQVNEMTRRGQREQQDLTDDGNDAQQEAINRIGQKMMNVLNKFAKQNSYSLVMDSSAQNTPVVYASNQVEITQQIIKLYDDTYPVKSAAPAAAHSAAQKPSQKR